MIVFTPASCLGLAEKNNNNILKLLKINKKVNSKGIQASHFSHVACIVKIFVFTPAPSLGLAEKNNKKYTKIAEK